MADDTQDGIQDSIAAADNLGGALGRLQTQTSGLAISANSFSRAMTQAFTQSAVGGKQFDEVLRSMALRLSNLAVTAAFKPIGDGIASGVSSLFSGLFGSGSATSTAKFADGGIIGAPTYFPMPGGGTGLAGEAGPEAIVPLSRGPDGRLGVAAGRSGGATSIQVHIATPDAESFRRSETYVTGQIARAVARGQRSL